ncbi:hypothetical protein NDU88_000350, partial [Pleurodeles waltl]
GGMHRHRAEGRWSRWHAPDTELTEHRMACTRHGAEGAQFGMHQTRDRRSTGWHAPD